MKLQPTSVQITEQPENVTATLGETATFHVAAEGSDLTSLWYVSKDGKTWTQTWLDGYNTDTLTFTATEGRINKMYRCVVTDFAGNVVTSDDISVSKKDD